MAAGPGGGATRPRPQTQLAEALLGEQKGRLAEVGGGLGVRFGDAAVDRVDQQGDQVLLLEEVTVTALARRQAQALRPLRGDVGGDAAVAGEGAGGVDGRHAADAQVARRAGRRRLGEDEVVEGLAPRQPRAEIVPASRLRRVAGHIPAALADDVLVDGRRVIGGAFNTGEAVPGVVLPPPVGGEGEEVAQARLARGQRGMRRFGNGGGPAQQPPAGAENQSRGQGQGGERRQDGAACLGPGRGVQRGNGEDGDGRPVAARHAGEAVLVFRAVLAAAAPAARAAFTQRYARRAKAAAGGKYDVVTVVRQQSAGAVQDARRSALGQTDGDQQAQFRGA